MTTPEYLKEEIFHYIAMSDLRQNTEDIVTHFRLRVDITLIALRELENEGRVVRHNDSLSLEGADGKHHYVAIPKNMQ